MSQSSTNSRQQYWVIGGEFRDTGFNALCAKPDAHGPFASYEDAFKTWQDRSTATRSEAHVRYTIAANPTR